MKKVLLGFLTFFLIAGTAYAADGSNTIRVKIDNIVSVLVNGKPVQSGQLIDGSTMLPLRAIAESLGVNVDWDNAKKQVSITTPQTPAQTGLSLEQLNKIGESVGLVYTYDGSGKLLGTGSGFVTNGLFITNAHVIEGGSAIEVWFGNEKQTINVSAAAFRNEETDLAGFEMEGRTGLLLDVMTPVKGDKVYALGYPHRKFQVSEGEILFFTVTGQISDSAPITNGSSGGILINSSGEVIGVTNAALDDTQYNNAIPAIVLQDELSKL